MLVFFSLIFIYPFVIQVANSFKTEPDAAANPLSPIPSRADAGRATSGSFLGTDLPLWLGNSVLVTVLVTLGRVFFDSLAGYALARLRFRGRRALFAADHRGDGGARRGAAHPEVPGAQPVRASTTRYTALIVPLLADAAGVFIMKQFFESIPVSVEEAARIDGAGTFRIFWSVVLPMARPALITLTILSFQGTWNELPHTLVAVQRPGAVHAAARARRPGHRLARRRAPSTRSSSAPRCSPRSRWRSSS